MTGNSILDNTTLYSIMKDLIQNNLNLKQLLNLKNGIQNFDSNIITSGVKSPDKKSYIQNLYKLTQINIENKNLILASLILLINKDQIITNAKGKVNSLYSNACPLSLQYDEASCESAYRLRMAVNEEINSFFSNLDLNILDEKHLLDCKTLYPSLDLKNTYTSILSQSINQSILKMAGVDYEERIFEKLKQTVNVSDIELCPNTKDIKNTRVEHDLKVSIGNKKIGISAKRTARERYRQNLAHHDTLDADRVIFVTLGIDFSEDSIPDLIKYDYPVFIADEVYNSNPIFQTCSHIYPVSQLTKTVLSTF